MVEEVEDDFDRFCRIGMGTRSEYSPGRQVYRDFLTAPTEINRNRAGSLRENRQRPHQHRGYLSSSHGRFSRTTTADDFINPNRLGSMRRYSLAPTYQNLLPRGSLQYSSVEIPVGQSSSTRAYTPTQKITPPVRKGSSGGVVAPPPINVYSEDDSPKQPDKNIVRVRSFRRTKKGVVDETETKRRLSHELTIPPMRRGSRTRSFKTPVHTESRLSDRGETVRSVRRKSFMDNDWDSNSLANSGKEQNYSANDSTVSELSEGDIVPHSGAGSGTRLYKVQVLGAEQVGKTTMCTQFLTSESLDAGFDSDKGNVLETVTVDVDGQQTSLLLIDSGNYDDPSFTVLESADAYLVVYAIEDRESFEVAQKIISEILGRCKIASAIVLVGNKADLVRARCVSYEGEGRGGQDDSVERQSDPSGSQIIRVTESL
ncbi:hypothetical protein Aperf_G00000111922 [Anoplocephala perfoliata]